MTENLKLEPSHKVLEIGTGSGYQAAVLSELCDHVYTIEIVDELANESVERLERLGFNNITVRSGDGYKGWPEEAPFDRIMVTAAPEEIPELLIEQLAQGGVMVIPVGKQYEIQYLWVITKEAGGSIKKEKILTVKTKVLDGRIFITGKVDNPEEKLIITKLAWETKGARSVRNDIKIKEEFKFKQSAKDILITSQLRTCLLYTSPSPRDS